MKRLFTYLTLVVLTLIPSFTQASVVGNGTTITNVDVITATFDFTSSTIRENIGEKMTDVKGYIYNETFTDNEVTLQITAGSAPSRIYIDDNRGQNLVTYKEYTTLTFCAPQGKSIRSIEFTAAGNSNINDFAPSSGAVTGMAWAGNAEGVRFSQGGTSYLAKIVVYMQEKDNETVALTPIQYVECANIASFNALAAGSYAKVTLSDAEIIGKSADGYTTVWIQDATGGCWIQYTSLNNEMEEKTKVNGFVYVVKRDNSGNAHMKEAEGTINSDLQYSPITNYTMAEGSLADVNIPSNLNKMVKISADSLIMTSETAGTLYSGKETIDVNNGSATANQQLHKISEWNKDTKMGALTMTAILVSKSLTAKQLFPISIVSVADGISNISSQKSNDAKIYNLYGVRTNKLSKGINIVNGKKFVK